jgi:four helix bundle protein
LEERLLSFAAAVINLSEMLPKSRAGNHISGQILRSGTSPYPNHGEAESAELREDFIHKLKVCLKELRETQRWTS